MALPIDTTTLTVLCGAPPTPVVDRDTGEHRTNRDGEALYRTELVVLGGGRAQIVGVRTPNEPKGLGAGALVQVAGLTVSTFTTKDGGTGVFYEASAVEASSGTTPAVSTTSAKNTKEAS